MPRASRPRIDLPEPLAQLPAGAAKTRLATLYVAASGMIQTIEAGIAARRKARKRRLRLAREGRAIRCSLCGLPVEFHGGDWGRCKANAIVAAGAEESPLKARWVSVPISDPPRKSPPVIPPAKRRSSAR